MTRSIQDGFGRIDPELGSLVRVVDHAPQIGRALDGGSDDGLADLVMDAGSHLAEGLGGLLGPVVALRPRADRAAGHLALGRLPLVVWSGVVQAPGRLGGALVAEEGPYLVGQRPD